MLSKKWIVETQQLIQQQKMLTANLCKVNFKRSDLRVLALMEEFLKILSNYQKLFLLQSIIFLPFPLSCYKFTCDENKNVKITIKDETSKTHEILCDEPGKVMKLAGYFG